MFTCLQRLAALTALMTITIAGCAKPGPPVIEVEGKVTYNGEPITTGMVKFIPKSLDNGLVRPAVGSIAADGTYQISAFPGRNGSRPGEYQVAIVSYSGSFADGTAKYLVPKRFSEPQTSGLNAVVPADSAGPLVLDFSLSD